MIGLLRKFGSYAIMCRIAVYLDLLEAVGPSKVFKGRGVMIYEVKSSIERTLSELQDLTTYESVADDVTTYLRRFVVQDSPDGKVLKPVFKSPGDGRKKVDNRQGTIVDMSFLQHLDAQSSQQAVLAKKAMAIKIIDCLKRRFDDYNNPIIQAISWFDPVNWKSEKTYGLAEIQKIYSHFQATLDVANFDKLKVVNEWVDFRGSVLATLRDHEAVDLWAEIF